MALQKQLVALPIDKGLDTKLDPKQEEPGFLRKAQNVVYETVKMLRKRNGYELVDLYTTAEVRVTDAVKLAKYKNELLVLTNSKLYSYSETRARLVEKGPLYSVSSTGQSVVKNANNQSQVDGLTLQGFNIFTWKDSSGGVRYSVQDLVNGSFLVANAVVSSTAERPVLAHIEGFVFIIYGEGANVKYKHFSVLEPETLSAATTAATDRHTTLGLIDAESSGSKIVVAYNADNAGDDLSVFTINDSYAASSVLGVTGESASHALDVMVDASSRIIITYSDNTAVKYVIFPITISATILSATTIEAVAGVTTCCSLETAAGVYRMYYEVSVAGVATNYVKQSDATVGGTVTNTAVFKRSVGLGARAFYHNDVIYIPTVHESEIQSSYFLFDEDGFIVTKFANQIAAGVIDYGVLQPVLSTATAQYMVPLIIHNRIQSDNGTFFSTDGIASTSLDFNPEFKYSNAQLADALHICAGVLRIYDGATVTEHGFHVFPEVLTETTISIDVTPATTVVGVVGVTSEEQTLTFERVPTSGSYKLNYAGEDTASIAWNASTATIKAAIEATTYITSTVTVTGNTTTGFLIVYDNSMDNVVQPTITSNTLSDETTAGFMSDGSYAYVAVYRWTDNTGRDHRSTPTLTPLTITLAGGTATQYVSVAVPTLRITDKTNVVLELYRTEDAGTTYYKVTNDLAPVLNDPTIDSISIEDTISDATLISREVLYTTGGVLENVAAPACFQVAAYNGERLAVVGEEANRVFFSKQGGEGRPVEFTDAIYRDIDPVGGTITALKAMTDKLIVFESDASFYISGEGPNNLGLQDSMNKPEIISTDIGCTSPDSTVLTPMGILFKSRKGIWAVGPGLGMEYLGARAEEFNAESITSAAVVGELNQIRFTLSTDRALVYNYQLDRWATFENHGALSAVVIGNDYYYLREDAALFKEDRTSFADAGSPIKMRIETGWLSLTELQGFQRAYHAMILGSFKSAHKLRVKLAYDFEEAWVQEVLIDTSDFIDAAAYGSDATYGDSSPYGGDQSLYQMRVDFMQQKCQSVKILIEDAQLVAGEGLSLSGVTIRVGAKSGSNKLPATQKYGAS